MNHALETIDYQHQDRFPRELTALVQDIHSVAGRGKWSENTTIIASHPARLKIEQLVLQRLGLRIEFQKYLPSLTPAAVIPYFGDHYRHLQGATGLFKELFSFSARGVTQEVGVLEKERKKLLKQIHGRTGFVNTRLAKVGGYLSELKHYLIIDFVALKSLGLSAPEVCAVILHELGHAFDGLEEHYRLQSTNRAILDSLDQLYSRGEAKSVYRFKTKFDAKDFESAMHSSQTERQDFSTELAMQYLQEVRSQMPNAKYDETNFENMADSFATRFGMGAELSSGLDRIYKQTGQSLSPRGAMLTVAWTVDVLSMALLFTLIPVWGSIVYVVVVSYLTRISASHMTYDEAPQRINRIRQTLVSALKDPHLPVELTRALLAQLDAVQVVLSDTASYQAILSRVGDAVFSDARADRYYVDLQRSIESQLANPLFVQSARLRVT